MNEHAARVRDTLTAFRGFFVASADAPITQTSRESAIADCGVALAALDEALVEAYIEGLRAYAYSSSQAWAESGVQYVGTSGTTLAVAIEQARKERAGT